jgi:hypothetical protein
MTYGDLRGEEPARWQLGHKAYMDISMFIIVILIDDEKWAAPLRVAAVRACTCVAPAGHGGWIQGERGWIQGHGRWFQGHGGWIQDTEGGFKKRKG